MASKKSNQNKKSNQGKNTCKKLKMYLEAKQVEYEDENGEDVSFTAYKTKIGSLNMDVRFTRDAEELAPKESGYFEVKTSQLSLDTRGDYPVLWIRMED